MSELPKEWWDAMRKCRVRSATREELAARCHSILDSAILGGNTGMMNAADEMADLLIELTGNTGVTEVEKS